jgi:hypothetical protein
MVLQQLDTAYPIISFTIKVAEDVPAGEYDLRFQSNSGEVAYIAGGLSVDEEGSAPLLMQFGETSGDDEASSSTIGQSSADEPRMDAIEDFLSGERGISSKRFVARRISLPGRAPRAGALIPLQTSAEERLRALVEPLLKRPVEGSRAGAD